MAIFFSKGYSLYFFLIFAHSCCCLQRFQKTCWVWPGPVLWNIWLPSLTQEFGLLLNTRTNTLDCSKTVKPPWTCWASQNWGQICTLLAYKLPLILFLGADDTRGSLLVPGSNVVSYMVNSSESEINKLNDMPKQTTLYYRLDLYLTHQSLQNMMRTEFQQPMKLIWRCKPRNPWIDKTKMHL